VREYLEAGLVDELHVPIVPLLLGAGERLFDGEIPTGYEVVSYTPSAAVAHMLIARNG
jgi:dihydrofolate reductase